MSFLLYYAGHGVQLNGGNYLLPADFSGAGSDLARQGILLDDVIQLISARSPKLKIIIIDACRDNPLDKNLKSGLANVNMVAYGSGTYIAMAASPGRLATDGLFARQFVAVLGITWPRSPVRSSPKFARVSNANPETARISLWR